MAKIEKFQSTTNAAGEIDEDAVFNLLATFEEDLQFEASTLEKKIEKLGDKATDNQIKKFLSATARYNFVVEQLGD